MDAGDFRHAHGAVDRGGDLIGFGLAESQGEQALVEFRLGRRGQTGHGGADIGQDNGLTEKRNWNWLRGWSTGLADDDGRRRRGDHACGGWRRNGLGAWRNAAGARLNASRRSLGRSGRRPDRRCTCTLVRCGGRGLRCKDGAAGEEKRCRKQDAESLA